MGIFQIFKRDKRRADCNAVKSDALPKIHLLNEADETIAFFTQHYVAKAANEYDADLLIYPGLIRDPANIKATLKTIAAQYSRYNKPVVIFVLSDFEGRYPTYKHLRLLRTSARQSLLTNNEFILPYCWESANTPFAPTKKTDKPLVGFCGLVSEHRKSLITLAEQNQMLACQFIKRTEFWGGRPHDPLLIEEYWDNMRNCSFMLAERGAGNFSMRFYQALSMGRIPVLVNMDMALPLPDKIKWKDAIVFENSEEECIQKILEIHQSGNTELRQKTCYDIYHNFLSEKKFLAHQLPKIAGQQ